jgi:hypothetical protein
MIRKIVFALAIVATLNACRDQGQDAEAPSAQDTQPAAAATAPAPAVELVPALKEPLAGGVQALPFKYHVAVERDVTSRKTGKVSREVGIEFLDGTVESVDQQVEAEFKKVDYVRERGEAQGKAIRSLYKKDGSPDVLVWVRPGAPRGERFKLQMPDAKGTVYLAWEVTR